MLRTRSRTAHAPRSSSRPPRAVGALFLSLALAVPVGAAAAAPAAESGSGDEAVSADATSTRGPSSVDWGECPEGWQFPGEAPEEFRFSCATFTVPLDHDRPRGAKIDLALRRLEAGDPDRRIGTLFLNPGGPGGSGVDFVGVAWALYSPEVLERFDIVGFDPRGVARSNPLVCFKSFEQIDRVFAGVPPFPVNRKQADVIDRVLDRYTDICDRRGGPIMDHMSTANVARDMDLMRRAVGDRRLTYAGYSYGSQLGTVYANLFPGKVRALIVDGVLDPIASTTGRSAAERKRDPFSTRLDSHVGARQTLQQFFTLCSEAGPQACSLAAYPDPEQVYADVAAELRRGPVNFPDGAGGVFAVTYQDLVGFSLGTMYSPFGWEFLADVVTELASIIGLEAAASTPSDATAQARVAERLLAAREPMTQTFEGFEGVSCSDSINPRSRDAWFSAGRRADREASYFGSLWTWASAACADWPGADGDRYLGPWSAKTSNSVLVIGNLYDPATAYSGALTVDKLLPRSRLLTLDGWGHTSLAVSSCVDGHVSTYLVTGRVPAAGTHCASDFVPFEPLPEAQARGADASRDQARRDARQIIIERLPSGGQVPGVAVVPAG